MHSSRPLLSLSSPDSAETSKQFYCVNGPYIGSLAQCNHSVNHSLTSLCVSFIHLIHQSACMPFIITRLLFLGGTPLKISTVVPLSVCMNLLIIQLYKVSTLPKLCSLEKLCSYKNTFRYVDMMYIFVHSSALNFRCLKKGAIVCQLL